MNADIGHLVQPGSGLRVQIVEVDERQSLKEVALDVAHRTLHLALGLWASRPMHPRLESVVLRKVEEFRVPLHLTVFTSADSYGFHVVVKNAVGNTLKVIERVDVAALQDRLMRFPHELDVE